MQNLKTLVTKHKEKTPHSSGLINTINALKEPLEKAYF